MITSFVLYYLLSVLLSKNNQFIQYRRDYSVSIEESKQKDYFIKELDSNTNLCFRVWIENSFDKFSIGLMPIEFSRENVGFIAIHWDGVLKCENVEYIKVCGNLFHKNEGTVMTVNKNEELVIELIDKRKKVIEFVKF